ncbi:MAG: fibronectin type III domain-containing protein, partial [Nitrosotalea sp.]
MKKIYYYYTVMVLALMISTPLVGIHTANAQIISASPPTNLTATAVSSSDINLSWTAPSGTIVTGYMIERSTNGGTTWSTIQSNTGSTATTYSDTGLAASTSYTYRVSTISLLGTSSPSNTASATTQSAATVPGSPTGLAATAGNTQVSLSWTAPANNGGSAVTNYKIYRSTSSGTETLLATTGNVNSYTDTTVTNGQTYYYKVSAVNSVGESLQSNEASVMPSGSSTSPQPPTGLAATAASSSQINLSWTAPANNGGSAITGYMIERSTDGTTWSTIQSNTGSTATTYSDTGLTASTAYTYRVSAINSVGTSSPSSTASATTQSAATAPQSPTGLAATAGPSQVSLSWTAPSSNGGSAITNYKIYRSTSSGTETLLTTVGNVNSYTDTTVTNGQTYYYKVTAVNSVGESTPSNEANAMPAAPATAPGAPTGLAATAASSSQINLSWTAPANNGGSAITGYKIERSTDGTTWSTVQSNTGTTATTYSDTGLTASTAYTYRVSAINSVGTSSPSSTSSATTSAGGTTQLSLTVNSVDLSGTPITGMSTALRYANGTTVQEAYTPVTFTVTSGVAYVVHVRDYLNNVFNHWSNGNTSSYYPITPTQSVTLTAYYSTNGSTTTVPSAPQNLQATAGNAQVSLSWTAPSSNGGSTVTNYKIYRSTSSGTETLLATTGNVNSYTDTTVTNGQTYYYKVSAVNSVGESLQSNEASVMPSGSSITAPSSPTGLAATAGNTQVSLSWTAPANNGGSAITGYNVYRGTTSGGESSTPVATGITSTTYTDTGLTNGQAYYYTVSAANSVGTSSPSNEASATPVAPATAPGAPTGLAATAASSSQINLSWTAPSNNGGSAITNYKIYRSTSSGTETLLATTGNVNSYTDTGLTNGVTYYYKVTAVNSVGESVPSSEASATPAAAATAPQPPTGLTVTAASSSQINLSWTAPANNGGSAITGYEIERSTDSGTTWSTIVANTASTATTYSDTGLTASTAYTYRVYAINSVGTSSPSNTASATTSAGGTAYSINQVQSGLVVSDSLTNETETQQQLQANPGYWSFGGSAGANNYTFWRDTQGLHIGVKAPSSGSYDGYYAVTQNTNAMLFNAILTTPTRTLPTPNVFYDNGLFVLSSTTGNANYVTCASGTSSAGTTWAVFSLTSGGTKFNTLWYDSSANQPLTRDCTIITNGTNYLKVYLDGTPVYENKTLNLQMPGPFNAFLEPESSYAGQLLNSTYKAYYAASDENVTVTNLPSGTATVKIVNGSGNVLATSQVSGGTAILDVGQYLFPLSGTIQVYDSSNNLITSSSASIYGGDAYSVVSSAPTAPGSPTGLAATAGKSQVSLSWTAPNNGGSAITKYNIYRGTASGSEGATPVGSVSGSTLTYTNTGLTNGHTYFYKVTAVNSVGESLKSSEASATPTSATVPQPPTGLTATASSSSQINLSWKTPNNGGS